MLTICWAAKGGSGTTTYAIARALTRRSPTLLVDLAGDVPTALGPATYDRPGVFDWLRTEAPASRLAAIEQSVSTDVSLITAGVPGVAPPDRWADLADGLSADPRTVIVDAGTGRPPAALMAVADEKLLVTRACYLALQRAIDLGVTPTGIVHVAEPGRRLRPSDLAASIGAPIVDTVLVDPAIAGATDSGFLVSRLPGGWRRRLESAA